MALIPEVAKLGCWPTVEEAIRLPPAFAPTRLRLTGVYAVPVPISKSLVEVPVATGFCIRPSTNPVVSVTVPLATTLFDPVARTLAPSASVPLTVASIPLSDRPAAFVTVRLLNVGAVVPPIVSAAVPLKVKVLVLALNVPLDERLPLTTWE